MVREARDRDRALAQTSDEVTMAETAADDDAMDVDTNEEGDEEPHGSKIIVIHPGSYNLRIGFANDALPKTIPMVIARKWKQNESEENGGEPKPKRVKVHEPEKQFGEEVQYTCTGSRSLY
jgi:actin-related protein 8